MSNSKQQVVAYDATGLLGIAFVVLKLCGVIDWSWWWVTLPFWGGIALALVVLAGMVIIAAIITAFQLVFQHKKYKRQKKARQAAQALRQYSNLVGQNRNRRIR